MTFLELAQRRGTTRGFSPRPVDAPDLTYVLAAGRVAPTACNRQPQRILVVQDPENLTRVRRAYQTFGAPCVLIVCRDTRQALIRPFDGKCSGDLDLGIVCDHMMLAARDRGLGSVLVGLFDPRILQREFHLPDHLEITALLFLGYPAGDFPSPHRHEAERKPLEETVRYETWDEEPAPA